MMADKHTNVVALDSYRARRKPRRPVRILAVDDRSTVRMIMQRLLENSGYAVSLAVSGEEALANLANYRFSLMLLDISMPDMDGFEVLQQVRSRYSKTELPIIMVTSRDDDAGLRRAMTLGANDYLSKPIDFAVLQEHIRALLDDPVDAG